MFTNRKDRMEPVFEETPNVSFSLAFGQCALDASISKNVIDVRGKRHLDSPLELFVSDKIETALAVLERSKVQGISGWRGKARPKLGVPVAQAIVISKTTTGRAIVGIQFSDAARADRVVTATLVLGGVAIGATGGRQ